MRNVDGVLVFWCCKEGLSLKATHLVCDPWTNEHCAEADSSRVSETARSRESSNNGPSRPQVRSEQSGKISASNSKLLELKWSDDIPKKQSRVLSNNEWIHYMVLSYLPLDDPETLQWGPFHLARQSFLMCI